MKMVLAIVKNDDGPAVSSALLGEGFQVTKLSSTGGILKSGNTTLIIGVEDDSVKDVIDIIAVNSSKRKQVMPNSLNVDMGAYNLFPVEITVGGAAIFVLNVDHYEKI